ncbi:MAG TPA: hypothetical protein VGT41_01345 [Candidatus Babeliales bacterium]|nr:hypothetical protein [Candidatus Babeliales bacterium]
MLKSLPLATIYLALLSTAMVHAANPGERFVPNSSRWVDPESGEIQSSSPIRSYAESQRLLLFESQLRWRLTDRPNPKRRLSESDTTLNACRLTSELIRPRTKSLS